MTNGPEARVCEIAYNTLPRERTRHDMHKHLNYYPMRNHLISSWSTARPVREELAADL